jgi:hypothetical protein
MPRGQYDRSKAKKSQTGPNHSAAPRPRYSRQQGQTVVNGTLSVDPPVPIVHIERGSGGDIRYSVRCPGVTAAGAREEAQRQFALLREFVESQGAQK